MKNWKRTGSILCAAVLAMNLFACGSDPEPGAFSQPPVSSSEVSKEESAVSSQAPTPVPVKEWKAPEPRITRYGSTCGGYVADECLVDENSLFPTTMPVYRIDYWEVAREDLDKAKMAEAVESFLRGFYEDDTLEIEESQLKSSYEDEYGVHELKNGYRYEDEAVTINAFNNDMRLSIKNDQELYEAVSAGDKEAVRVFPVVQTALQIAGVKEAELALRYDSVAEQYLECEIWEKGANAGEDAVNRGVKGIEIRVYPRSGSQEVEDYQVSFSIPYQPLEKKIELPVLTYQKAYDYLMQSRYDSVQEGVRCKITYVALHEEDGRPSMTVPNYEFVDDKTHNSHYIPMVDYEAITEEDFVEADNRFTICQVGTRDGCHILLSPRRTCFPLEQEDMKPFPVYLNPYPDGQVGQLYELGREEKDQLRNYVEDYLTYFYGEEAEERIQEGSFSIKESTTKNKEPHQHYLREGWDSVTYQDQAVKIRALINSVCINVPGAQALSEALKGNDQDSLLENKYIVAALWLLDIENPLVRNVTTKQLDGRITEYMYKITERSEDLFENARADAFHSLTISVDADEESEVVLSLRILSPRQEIPLETVSYQQARDYVLKKYPEQFSDGFSCEVYYDIQIREPFCIPVYGFYTDEFAVDIAMADYMPIWDAFMPGEEFVWPREES